MMLLSVLHAIVILSSVMAIVCKFIVLSIFIVVSVCLVVMRSSMRSWCFELVLLKLMAILLPIIVIFLLAEVVKI